MSNLVSAKTLQFSKLSIEDFRFEPDMYRDIIKKYSPALLFYIDNMQYNYEYMIVANLLSLVNKKYIEIDGEKINIIKYDYYNLELSEKFVIENIRNNKINIDRANLELKELVEEEGKRKGILENKVNWIQVFFKSVKLLIAIVCIAWIITLIVSKITNINFGINENAFGIFFTLAWVFICMYAINFQKNSYIRTEKANEINKNLEGLKAYIKNYSELNKKESKEISLWEDYLIYSVIFKHNKKILNEYKQYLNSYK